MQLLYISFRTLVIAATLGLLVSACPLQKRNEMHPIGPGVKASLVIYFKAGVTEQEIEKFLHEALTYPDPEGRGRYHKNGVGTLLRVYPPVQGHEAIAVTFLETATETQRREIKSATAASILVYKVLENVAPSDVKKIE